MATTVTPATMSVALTTSIVLDGETVTFNVSSDIPTVSTYRDVLVNVPFAAEIDILGVDSAGIGGLGQLADSKFIVVKNMDDTNFCRVRYAVAGAQTIDKRLNAGEFDVFYNTEFDVDAAQGAFAAFVDIEEINAQFDTADSQLRVYMVF